jgi:hypothetical protein
MAASSIALAAGDLRRSATESKRDHDHKAKWAFGTRDGRNQLANTVNDPHLRPAAHRPVSRWDHKQAQSTINRKVACAKVSLLNDVDEALNVAYDNADSSADEDVPEPGAASENPNIYYSFDAASAPRQGDHILGIALARAVEKFEIKETEKLVREYEFVPHETQSECGDRDNLDEDDFELVHRVEL